MAAWFNYAFLAEISIFFSSEEVHGMEKLHGRNILFQTLLCVLLFDHIRSAHNTVLYRWLPC